jgi:type IV secretory pathway TraG/TraD family ATPase VirD4
MKTLIETLFELCITLVKGVFDLICFVFQINTNERLFEHSEMKGSDRRKLISRLNKGLVINGKKRISVKQSLTHVLVVGKSGIGKTSSYFLPNLLKATNQSFVVTDMDGAMFNSSSGYLKKQGYNIQVLNFNDISKSEFFNALAFCKSDDDLKALAEKIILSSNASKGSSDQFWNFSSIHLLYFLFRLVKTQPKEVQSLYNVRHLLHQMETAEFQTFVIQNSEGILFSDFLSFHSKDLKLRTSIQAGLGATMDLFSYSEIAHITSKNTIDINKLTQGKAALFIIIPENKLKRYSLILSTVYNVIFEHLQKNKPSKPVQFLLDESGVVYQNDLEVLISILRKYNCSLSLGIQDISQLRKLYGNDASSTIISNTSTKLIFPGASLELANEISRISGQKSVEILFEGKLQQKVKSVLSPTDVIQMKPNKALVLVSNFPPVILKMFPYFKQFTLKRRSKLKPVELESNPMINPQLIELSKKLDNEEI